MKAVEKKVSNNGAFFRAILSWSILLVWFVVLWVLSSRESVILPGPEIPHLDKVMHFGYFGLGGLIFALATPAEWSAGRRIGIAGAVFLLLGTVDEYHQSHVAGRSGNDVGDLTADVLGALTGAWAGAWILRIRGKGGLDERGADDTF